MTETLMIGDRASCTRRRFLHAAAALTVPAIVPAAAMGREGRPAAGDRITVGVVGVGSRGFNLLEWFGAETDAQIVAVCDVDRLHYRDNPWGKGRAFGLDSAVAAVQSRYAKQTSSADYRGCRPYADFRELCAAKDIDAVVVATPDHWHYLCAMTALGQGKDVYCEKPVTHYFAEGQRLYREVAWRKAVFQAGSQQRSDSRFQRAVELVRNGRIGKVQQIEVGLPEGYGEPQGDTTVTQPPEQLNYDFWCGPAPVLPYMRARHHRWWRGNRAYGGGTLMDWIGHHNDIAHWGLGLDQGGPTKVELVSWVLPQTEIYNTPHHFEIRCEYDGGAVSSISDRHAIGTKWIGQQGWIAATRGKLEASDPAWLKPDFDPGPLKVEKSERHARNFLDCVKSRQPCVATAEIAHRSITPGHLAYVAAAVGRALRWDARAEKILGDDEADKLLKQVSYRQPWDSGLAG